MANKGETAVITKDGEAHAGGKRKPQKMNEHVVEIVSDSGEGAQKCGQAFGTISAKRGMTSIWPK